MRGSSFGYLVKQGIINTWINRMMSMASIGILTACMIIVGGSGLLAVNIRDVFKEIEEKNELVVFVQDDADDITVNEINDRIARMKLASMGVEIDALTPEQKAYLGLA